MAATRRPRPSAGLKKLPKPAPKRLAPPDFKSCHIQHGLPWSDIPDERVMRWPNDQGVRRTVFVSCTSWRGISLGASHFYVKIEPEQNQVWDGENIRWITVRDWGPTKKESFECTVLTREQAVLYLATVLNAFFSDEKLWDVQGHGGDEGIPAVLAAAAKD